LLTELGDIKRQVPRTRRYSALEVVRAYARRAADGDRMILACSVLGLSTRKVASALLPALRRRVSDGTVSGRTWIHGNSLRKRRKSHELRLKSSVRARRLSSATPSPPCVACGRRWRA
jgi:hypothetical protein